MSEQSMIDADALAASLAPLREFWEHWGFEPWSRGPLAGVSRIQRFVKGGILGRVAEYRAWDCIVWSAGTNEDREQLWRACRPMSDVLTQRFLFLVENPSPERRIRSFAWGFMGYLEFYEYLPGHAANDKVRDLTGLIDLGLGLAQNKM